MSDQYFVARGGEQSGPYTLEQMQQMLAAGQLLPTDMAWTEGQADWLPVPQLAGSADPEAKSSGGKLTLVVRCIVGLLLVVTIVLFIFDYLAKSQRQEVFNTLDEMGSQVELGKVREITGRDPVDVNASDAFTSVTYSWKGGLRKHLLIIRYDGYSEDSGVGFIDELELR